MKPEKKRLLRSKEFRAGVILAGICSSAGLVLQPALAGEWRFDHSTELKLSYVDRTGEDGYDGMVLQATPNLHLYGEGARVQADINYNPTLSEGTSDTDPEFLTHDLLGNARIEAVEDRFFLGFDARADLTADSGSSAGVDAINFNSEDGQQVYSFGIGPEFRQHLNRYADIISRNRVDWVRYSGNDNSSTSDSSRSQTLNLQLISGRHFTKYAWSLDATQRKTYFDSDRDDETRTNYSANVSYRIDARWGVNGSIGYEDNDDISTDRDSTNGTTWDVGANWTPNPRTRASVQYGDRYFGDRWAADFSHTSRRTRLSADFSREVTNRRSQEIFDAQFFLVNSSGNVIVDPNTGNPIIVSVPQAREVDEDYISTRFRGIVTLTGKRTNVTITGRAENRDYEISSNDEDVYGLRINADRDLGHNFSGTLYAGLEHIEGSGVNDNETYDFGFTLNKSLSPRSSAALDLRYRDYNDDAPDEDYEETRIGISFTTTYL